MAERVSVPVLLCLLQWFALISQTFSKRENACETHASAYVRVAYIRRSRILYTHTHTHTRTHTRTHTHTHPHTHRTHTHTHAHTHTHIYIFFPFLFSLSQFSEVVRSRYIWNSGYLTVPRTAHGASRCRPRVIIDQRPVPVAMCHRGWWSWRWRVTLSSARPRPRDTFIWFIAEQVKWKCIVRPAENNPLRRFVSARPVAVRGKS